MSKSKGFGSLLDYMKLGNDDEDDDDDLFDDEDEDVIDDEPKHQKPSLFSKKDKIMLDDEDTYTEPKKNVFRSTKQGSGKLVSINNSRGMEVYVIKPQEFNEAQTVTDFLKDGKTIVINMEGIEINAAQRIVDFIGGACYALDGTLQAVSSNIFIAAPTTTDVSGDLREEILNESILSPDLGKY